MMRRIVAAVLIVGFLSSTGCSAGDVLFGLLGSYHSSACKRDDRRADFESSVENWKSYGVTSSEQ